MNIGVWNRRELGLAKLSENLRLGKREKMNLILYVGRTTLFVREIPHVNEGWAGKKKCSKGHVKMIANI